MKRSRSRVEEKASDAVANASVDWTEARATTQIVAFRVIRTESDGAEGRTPIWGAFPLTEEEEEVLRGLNLQIS